jgi:glycosyltransferase involved in cell wall biosynthesis
VRVLIFHGYLLHGTGSNVYTARLAAALAAQGHEVHLLSQDARPPAIDGVTHHRPAIGHTLPVYVADRYEGFDARPFVELDDAAIAEYVARNVAAVQEIAAAVRPEIALANHLVMGSLILARGLPADVSYAVKIHGSALEYVVKRDPARFLPAAREGLARAATVLVGSRHTAESLWAAMDDPALPERTRLGPPGVDVEEFRPREDRAAALGDLQAMLRVAPKGTTGSAFDRDPAEALRAVAAIDPAHDRLVTFVGKLIVSKGVDLLAVAWPLVLAQVPNARLVIVGFGAYRDAFERLVAALTAGDLASVRDLAAEGRAAEGGPRAPLERLRAFLDDLDAAPDRDAYLAAARRLPERLLVAGRLEHAELAPLLAACEAQVVPSTFPEAFGMVAVEAAACGALPVVADHSGLGEIRAILAAAVPEAARELLGFDTEDRRAVRMLAARLVAWLRAPGDVRAATRAALVATARERFSWDGVAHGVVAAARGEHDALARP